MAGGDAPEAPQSPKEPEVVFDSFNGQISVTERLAPGDDGYLSLVTKARRAHESLKETNVKK